MDLKSILAREYTQATDYYTNNLEQNNEDAYDYFNLKKPGVIDKDISESFESVVSPDVANAVEHTLADIMPAFASEAPVSFRPDNLQDEAQTQIETQLVNNIFIQQSNGFVQLTTAIKEAMLCRLGAIEVQVYEKKAVSYSKLTDVNVGILASFLQQQEPNSSTVVVEIDGELVEDGKEQLLSSNFTAVLRKTVTTKQLSVEAFPRDELLFNSDHEDLTLDTARFTARRRVMTASDLVELGIDKDIVAELPAYTHGYEANRPHKQRDTLQERPEETHESNKLIRVAYCYFLIDEDGDGIAERRKFIIAGDLESSPTILVDEPCSTQPFAIGIPFIYPHRVDGISLFDKIKQVQDINSKVIRQLLTAGERAVRGRVGVVGTQANMDDMRETIFGGIVRMTTPNGLVPIPMDRFPTEVAALLDITGQQRKESGGSAIDKASEEVLIGGDTAHGLERIMSAMEQLNSLVAKTLAETLLRQVYVKMHEALRKHFTQPISQKVDGTWVTSTPANWPVRKNVSVALGLTMGDRMRMAQNYTALITEQKELISQGSVLATEQSLYQMLIARANAMMIPHAQSYYVDPASPEGRHATQQRAEAQKQKQQQEMQVQMMNMQLLPQIEQIKAQSSTTVQMMKNEMTALELKLEQLAENSDLELKYNELRLKLAELNAKYDNEAVPDTVQ